MEIWLNSFSGFEVFLTVVVGYFVMLGALFLLACVGDRYLNPPHKRYTCLGASSYLDHLPKKEKF